MEEIKKSCENCYNRSYTTCNEIFKITGGCSWKADYVTLETQIQQVKEELEKYQWISAKEKLPYNQERVFVLWINSYGKERRSIAQYIGPKTVLAEDFMDPESDFEEYDEENDCFWTPAGWYESQYATDINFFIDEEIVYWMPLLPSPKTLTPAKEES